MFLRQWPKEGQKVSLAGPVDDEGNPTTFEWKVKPTINTSRFSALRIQDMMILHILKQNRWRKPIYFAVTVSPDNKLGLERFLRMDGLAFKVLSTSPIPIKSDGAAQRLEPLYPELIVPMKIEENLVKNYKYRKLDDPDVYLNPSIKRLLQNYRSAFLQLGYHYMLDGNKSKLAGLLESMEKVMPESVIEVQSKMAQLQIGAMEKKAGFPEKMRVRLEKLVANPRNTFNDKMIYGSYYMRDLEDYKTAAEIFSELVGEKSNSGRAVGMLVSAYELGGEYESAANVLREWLVNYPADSNARLRMNELRAKIKTAGESAPGDNP